MNNDQPDRVCKFTEHVSPCNWYQERAFYAKFFAQNIRHAPLGDILVPFEAFFFIDWLVLGVQTWTEKQIHSDMSVGHGRLRFQVVKPFLPGNFIRIVPI